MKIALIPASIALVGMALALVPETALACGSSDTIVFDWKKTPSKGWNIWVESPSWKAKPGGGFVVDADEGFMASLISIKHLAGLYAAKNGTKACEKDQAETTVCGANAAGAAELLSESSLQAHAFIAKNQGKPAVPTVQSQSVGRDCVKLQNFCAYYRYVKGNEFAQIKPTNAKGEDGISVGMTVSYFKDKPDLAKSDWKMELNYRFSAGPSSPQLGEENEQKEVVEISSPHALAGLGMEMGKTLAKALELDGPVLRSGGCNVTVQSPFSDKAAAAGKVANPASGASGAN